MIAVLRPTRGLEFSESADSIDRAFEGVPYFIKRTWNLPIPDSFNWLARWALRETQAKYFWFIEEDVIVPPDAVTRMIALNTDVMAVNYRLKTDARISQMERQGKLLWVSLGCTLIRRKVFETLPEPWFSTDYTLASRSTGSACKEKIMVMIPSPRAYAGHDSYICFKALEAGFTIGAVPDLLCEHLKLDAMGQANVNNGCHRISRA